MLDMKAPDFLLLTSFLSIWPIQVSSLTCFACRNLARPRTCTFVVDCGVHEECYVDQFVTRDGHIFYNSGCRDTRFCRATRHVPLNNTLAKHTKASVTTNTCQRCCNSNICNSAGCGETGFASPVHRGPMCYNCTQQSGVNTCNHVHMCSRDEVCRITTAQSHVDMVYTTGCARREMCNRNTQAEGFGRRFVGNSVAQRCLQCCSGDLCNKKCTGLPTVTHVTPTKARDCLDILHRNPTSQNGKYTIYQADGTPKEVRCDMTTEGGGWTVFQRRQDRSTDFYRDWKNYTKGFGQADSNYYLGNEILHQLANPQGRNQLFISLVDYSNKLKVAKYSDFSISNEYDGFRLHVSGYSGDAGDSLQYHNGMQFTTYNEDHDSHFDNCAILKSGAWWYRDCNPKSNLNGHYFTKGLANTNANFWFTVNSNYQALKQTEMMVRRVT